MPVVNPIDFPDAKINPNVQRQGIRKDLGREIPKQRRLDYHGRMRPEHAERLRAGGEDGRGNLRQQPQALNRVLVAGDGHDQMSRMVLENVGRVFP